MKFLSLLSLTTMVGTTVAIRTAATKKDPSKRRHLEEVCTVDHETAQHHTELDVKITEMMTAEGTGYFKVEFDDPQYGGSNTLDGWCIDFERLLFSGDYKMDVLSLFDSDVHDDAVAHVVNKGAFQYFPNLAYLVNTYYVDMPWTNGTIVDGAPCDGTIGWLEIQGAIWGMVTTGTADPAGKPGYYNGTGTAFQTMRTECIANYIKYDAIANGDNYEIDCTDEFEEVPLAMWVDNDTVMTTDSSSVISDQVIISEILASKISGLCDCGTPTAAPTKAPTSPNNERSAPTPEYEKAPTPSSASGDPHFKTWTGDKFDYHGECDLVLVDNPRFNEGQGLKIHIRTTRVKYFSYIQKIAVQIGSDVLEFANDAENFLINGEHVEQNKKHHKTHLGGFIVRRDRKAVSIRLHDEGRHSHNVAKIDLHTRKNGFPAVIVDGGDSNMLEGSLGLLGDWATGKKIGRDGVTEMNEEDATAYAEEWQVRDDEPMLFSEARAPQYPAKCLRPQAHLHNRLGADKMRKEAEKACAHWKEDKDDCIFDVIATRDVLVAAEGHIVHLK